MFRSSLFSVPVFTQRNGGRVSVNKAFLTTFVRFAVVFDILLFCTCVVWQSLVLCWLGSGSSGALLEKAIEILPEVASKVAAPLEKTETLVFVESGDSGQKMS